MLWKNNDKAFEQIFRDHIGNTVSAAEELQNLFGDLAGVDQHYQKIVEFEHRGDQLVARAHELLDTTFITRLDKPDIVELVDELDHVVDGMRSAATLAKAYHLAVAPPKAGTTLALIVKMTRTLEEIFGDMAKLNFAKMKTYIRMIKELEEEADRNFADDLEHLFAQEGNLKTVIAWKDILQVLERITDHSTHVMNTMSSIVRKEAR